MKQADCIHPSMIHLSGEEEQISVEGKLSGMIKGEKQSTGQQ